MDDLDDIAFIQGQRCVGIPVTENGPVVLDDYEAGIDSKRAEQARDGAVTVQLPSCSVHHQGDRSFRFRRLNHTLKYSG
jgi:hypothetical protein